MKIMQHLSGGARGNGGFTLIELMIVVVIVALLMLIALPAYQKYGQRARRGDAITSLMNARVLQEQYRAESMDYGDMTDLGLSATSKEGHYTVGVVGTPGTDTYLMTAAPTGVQSGDDCGTYAIDQNGPNYTGSYASSDCWRR